MADQDQLKALRLRIDSLDEKLLELISERARCAQDVARVKTQTLGEGEAPVFYRPEREAWVLKHIMQLNKGPLDNEEVARLFREIMSSCLALEQPLKVAYLGPEGTFTQAAALKHFGNAVISTPMAAIDEVFREVAAGAVNFGVVPVEKLHRGGGQPYPRQLPRARHGDLRRSRVAYPPSPAGRRNHQDRQHHPDLFPCPIPRAMSQVAGLRTTRASSGWRCRATPTRPSG